MEEMFYEKLDKRKRDRNNVYESLGGVMVDAGNEFGPGTAYGELSFHVRFCFRKYKQRKMISRFMLSNQPCDLSQLNLHSSMAKLSIYSSGSYKKEKPVLE